MLEITFCNYKALKTHKLTIDSSKFGRIWDIGILIMYTNHVNTVISYDNLFLSA